MQLIELPSLIPIDDETLRWYQEEFPQLVAIETLSKIAYPNVSIETCLENGGNIAAGADGIHLYLDCDLDCEPDCLPPCLKEVARRTPTAKSPKGYGFILLWDSESEPIRKGILTKIIDMKASKYLSDVEDLEQATKDRQYWESLGFKDATCIHGINSQLKIVLDNPKLLEKPYQDYMLLPGSVSCRYQGHKGKVRDHSSTFPNFCNQSPDSKHHYLRREWLNKGSEMLTFSEFWEIVWNGRVS